MLHALFNKTFTIGSLHPSMKSSPESPLLSHSEHERPDSPPPPKPISGPIPQKEHMFPETGGMSCVTVLV